MDLALEGYKKEIEIFLATMSIFKGTRVMNNNKLNEEQNKRFIKTQFIQMHSDNVDEKTLDRAIDELYPYLYETKGE